MTCRDEFEMDGIHIQLYEKSFTINGMFSVYPEGKDAIKQLKSMVRYILIHGKQQEQKRIRYALGIKE